MLFIGYFCQVNIQEGYKLVGESLSGGMKMYYVFTGYKT